MSTRKPVVAGFFYPKEKEKLIELIEWTFMHELGPRVSPQDIQPQGLYNLVSAVVPHAGYIYSGPCAAHTYAAIKADRIPETIIIIGPNHTGLGYPVSVYPKGKWETPLGELEIDSDLVNELAKYDVFKLDTLAHEEEHSIEVQLPYIIYTLGKNVKIVPIVMMDQRLSVVRDVAGAIIDIMEEGKKDILVLASSDMSHYVPKDLAYERDWYALEKVERLDVEGFYETIEKFNITACGYGPIAVAMLVAKFLNRKGAVLQYYTSGDIAGNEHSVVGYASVIFGDFIMGPPRRAQKKEAIFEEALVV